MSWKNLCGNEKKLITLGIASQLRVFTNTVLLTQQQERCWEKNLNFEEDVEYNYSRRRLV